jgi:prevent-host-death family protein
VCTYVYTSSTLYEVEELGIRDLRANAAAMVRRAAAGERIVITVNGRAAAQLGPIDAGQREPGLADLVVRGLVRAPSSTDRAASDNHVELWAGVRLDRLLSEVRGR